MDRTPLNEFRKDPISGDWVLFAAYRSQRPGWKEEKKQTPAKTEEGQYCVFEDQNSIGPDVISQYKKPDGQNWVTVIRNKYPAVTPGVCEPVGRYGPVSTVKANGFHEVVITQDHHRNFSEFTTEETTIVLQALRDRYLKIAEYACGDYIQIFNNSGREAGASVEHPHSQIISTPIIPPSIARSLNGSAGFFLKHHQQKAHLSLLNWERAEKTRIIFENQRAVSYCPFVSKNPYQIKIIPIEPNAYFERSCDDDLNRMAEAINFSLSRLKKIFPNIAYNFYIHTAPVRERDVFPFPCSDFYHWHIEVVPHISTLAGFDYSTGIVVNVVDPDRAARELREAK